MMPAMIKQVEQAVDCVYALTEQERKLVREDLDELDRGEVATEAQVRAVFEKYRVARHD